MDSDYVVIMMKIHSVGM